VFINGGTARSNLAAFDIATGEPTPWMPEPDGAVSALVVDGHTVYVGGDFSRIGGQIRSGIAALDITTAQASSWNPEAREGTVSALAVDAGTVYVGGNFTGIGTQARSGLAAIDATTGIATSWNPNATYDGDRPWVRALALRGDTVYAGGMFTGIGGYLRRGVAALYAATGQALIFWDANGGAPTFVWALAVSGDVVYAGGNFGNIGGQPRSFCAALDANSGAATPWDPHANLFVESFVPSGGVVYVGGSFTTIGGLARHGLAALDPEVGVATDWDPKLNGDVSSMVVGGGKLYATGNFSAVGPQPRSGIAAIDIVTTGVLLSRFEAQAIEAGILLRWRFEQPEVVARIGIERSANDEGPWSALLVETTLVEGSTEALDRTAEPGRDYSYRLITDFSDGSRMTFGPIRVNSIARSEPGGLLGIVPNPVSSHARIDFSVARDARVRISIVDVSGREVEVLADRQMDSGRKSLVWDGRQRSQPLPAGVYFVRWESPGKSTVRKLIWTPR
jgi:hypothetical protein